MPKVTRFVCRFLPLLPAVAGAAVAEPADFFEKRIRPLLAEHCLECHGAEKQKGGLRLDHRAGWQQGGDSGPTLLPGKADESLLWKVVSYQDRDLKMPPREKLPAAALEDLKTWIASGAHDPRTEIPGTRTAQAGPKADGNFWSFQPPKKAGLPQVKTPALVQAPADAFIQARLETEGASLAAEAPPDVLLRRLAFDLTGLPPEAAFAVAGISPADAAALPYEKQVEALLDSPAFAERWTSHFMDITRFAESSGGGRSLPFLDAWRFRDYLLEALRSNQPVDKMITQMVAGDLLPARDAAERRQNLTATGFLVLGPTNYEEQDKQMLRMDIVDEQMDTLGRSFLGMTLGCARCHDHKFDPIPTRDYYALAGILRSTRTLKNYTDNVARWIDTPLPLEGEEELRLQAREQQLDKLTQEIATLKDNLRDLGGATLRKRKALSPADLPGIVVDDAQAQKVGQWKSSHLYPPFIGGGYVHDLNEGRGEKTVSFTPKLPAAGRYEVRVAYIAGPGRAERVPATIFHADGEELVYFKQATESLNGLQFASLGTFRFETTGQNFVMLSNAGAEGFVTVDAVQFVPAETEASAPAPTVAGQEETGIKQRMAELQKELKHLQKEGPVRAQAMSVADDPLPEDARIHIRGSIRNLGSPVPRGFIQVAMKGDDVFPIAPQESGRLQLARWMTSRDNPLTARVFVNRVWHWLFGAGLVRTTDNFGATGELPSHPELLDFLAVRFMEDGWNLKRLIKDLVLSRTYRQSSEAAGLAQDPDNRLLSRMNRKRLDAESLRDAMLASSGLLSTQWGGPNINGNAVMNANDSKTQNLEYGYVFEDDRRSVYTAAFRNVRHPLFEVFDFADINQPVGQRTTSTIAPQALYFMNHPQVVALSREAAERLLKDAGDSPAEVLFAKASQNALQRPATARETAIATEFIEATVSGNSDGTERRDAWARLIQTLWATPDFRFLK
ncbi:MAG TPA: DUF1553 domain-containing protein [Prosthecobacter sp.]